MKRSILVLLMVLGLSAATQTSDAGTPDITLFDNWNTAACSTTNQVKFSIKEDALISRIVVWSDTRLGGGILSGTLSGPQGSMSISSTRGNCDPYQHQWCEQVFAISRSLSAGDYSIKLNTNSVCQNNGSRGNGFVRVFGSYAADASHRGDSPALIADVRGEWEVVASGYKAMWIVGNDGRKIFGASKWSCCPGFRVDRISGEINGTRVEITRYIIGQGSESGTQTWHGTIQGDRISGSWSGLGGSGDWTAHITR